MSKFDLLNDIVMELTDPLEDLSIEDAKKYLKKAVELGYDINESNITPEEFIEMYEDCEPFEEN